MTEKVLFFDHEGDTRKITYTKDKLTSLEDLMTMLAEKYDDVTIDTKDVIFWTTDQTYKIRHKLDKVEDIYEGALIEVTSAASQKRMRKGDREDLVSKRPRVTGPRFVVRLRGLPWKATQKQIREFFEGIEVVRIQILNQPDGRASGDGLVEFKNEDEMNKGMLKDKEHIGERYIEVSKSTGCEMDRALGVSDPCVISNTYNKVLKMRGLPWSAAENDILEFFKEGDLVPEKVHLVSDVATGRASGEALVEFESEEQIVSAMKLNRNEIGSRYIELFRASMGELRRVLGLAGMDMQGQGGLGEVCISMRGLPWNTTEADIIDFFKEVDVMPVRIHRKEDGSEAFVEFNSFDASKAMSRHKSYIGHRYVELSRVSYDQLAGILGGRGQGPAYRLF